MDIFSIFFFTRRYVYDGGLGSGRCCLDICFRHTYQNPVSQSTITPARMTDNDNSYVAIAAYIGLVIAKWVRD